MELSKRLEAVASLVSRGNRLADVGTDHGYIPIALVERQWIPSAIALDINRGPLERASLHIREHGLEEKIQTRLSDGVNKLRLGEVDAVVIAGMGGPLLQNILSAGKDVLSSVKELVLQPQSEIGGVRHFLEANNYEILEEKMIEEDGKFYPMMRVCHGQMHYESEAEYRYGHFLLQEKNEVLYRFLRKEKTTLTDIYKHLQNSEGVRAKAGMQEVAEKLQVVEDACAYFENRRKSHEM